jgi:sarcosine oxidase subunit gamma
MPLADDGLIGRLATSEFLIEDGPAGGEAARIAAALEGRADGVYPVLRQDCALALTGHRALDVLLQTCNVHFAALALDRRPLVMTSMAGVSVLVIPQDRDGVPVYRIWCDPSYAPYLHRTLLEIVAEEGGGPVGFARLYPASPHP